MIFRLFFPAMVVMSACARPRLPADYTLDALISSEAACQDGVALAEDHRIQRIQVERDIEALRESIRRTEVEINEMLNPAADRPEGL